MKKIMHEQAKRTLKHLKDLISPKTGEVINWLDALDKYIFHQEDFEAKVKRYLELGFPIYEDESAVEQRSLKAELKEMVGLK